MCFPTIAAQQLSRAALRGYATLSKQEWSLGIVSEHGFPCFSLVLLVAEETTQCRHRGYEKFVQDDYEVVRMSLIWFCGCSIQLWQELYEQKTQVRPVRKAMYSSSSSWDVHQEY